MMRKIHAVTKSRCKRTRLAFKGRSSKARRTTAVIETNYRVTEIPISALKMTVGPIGSVGAQAPSYNREVDEPAFDAAWRHVAELRSQGKVAPVPPFPKGGLRLRGPRHREAK